MASMTSFVSSCIMLMVLPFVNAEIVASKDACVAAIGERSTEDILACMKQDEFDAHATDRYGRNYLHYVADLRQLEDNKLDFQKIVTSFIEAGVEIDAIINENAGFAQGQTPLHAAIGKENNEVAEVLIQKGANVSLQNQQGFSPLHIAAGLGNLELTKLLIDKGANCTLRGFGKYESTPLHLAASAMKGSAQVIRACIESDEYAKNVISYLQNKKGATPLHGACAAGNVESVKLLLDVGADVTIENDKGQTPLDVGEELAYNGNLRMDKLKEIRALIQSQAQNKEAKRDEL